MRAANWPMSFSIATVISIGLSASAVGQGRSTGVVVGGDMPARPEPLDLSRSATTFIDAERLPACPVDLLREAYALATTGFQAVDLVVIESEILAACTRNRTALLRVLEQERELADLWQGLLADYGTQVGVGENAGATANSETQSNPLLGNPAAPPQGGSAAGLTLETPGAVDIEAMAGILGTALGVDADAIASALRAQGIGEATSSAEAGQGGDQVHINGACPSPRPSDNYMLDNAFINQIEAFDRPPVGTPMAGMVVADSYEARYRGFTERELVVAGDMVGGASIEEGGVEVVEVIPYQPDQNIEDQVTLRDCAGERIAERRPWFEMPASMRNLHPDTFIRPLPDICPPEAESCTFDRDPYGRQTYPVEEE